jgi:2-dehydro-3-deoxyphosphooctonate aldolase (KDO 8-P synthase)
MQALALVKKVGDKYKLPTTSDIHAHEEAAIAAKYIDILQIPAFLCRQTDLLMAAGETGKIVNVKKGQFLSGPSMKFAVEKIKNTGNEKIILTERGLHLVTRTWWLITGIFPGCRNKKCR